MFDFKKVTDDTIELKVNLNIYSDTVISKVLYWLSANFIIERKTISTLTQQILLKHKNGNISGEDLEKYMGEIAQMFADYKVREIVRKETEGIRNILYLKAFANCSDLEDLRGD